MERAGKSTSPLRSREKQPTRNFKASPITDEELSQVKNSVRSDQPIRAIFLVRVRVRVDGHIKSQALPERCQRAQKRGSPVAEDGLSRCGDGAVKQPHPRRKPVAPSAETCEFVVQMPSSPCAACPATNPACLAERESSQELVLRRLPGFRKGIGRSEASL